MYWGGPAGQGGGDWTASVKRWAQDEAWGQIASALHYLMFLRFSGNPEAIQALDLSGDDWPLLLGVEAGAAHLERLPRNQRHALYALRTHPHRR